MLLPAAKSKNSSLARRPYVTKVYPLFARSIDRLEPRLTISQPPVGTRIGLKCFWRIGPKFTLVPPRLYVPRRNSTGQKVQMYSFLIMRLVIMRVD
jgi:hypothetical protein